MTEPLHWMRRRDGIRVHLIELRGNWLTSLCGFPLALKASQLELKEEPKCPRCIQELQLRAAREKRGEKTH